MSEIKYNLGVLPQKVMNATKNKITLSFAIIYRAEYIALRHIVFQIHKEKYFFLSLENLPIVKQLALIPL